MEDDRDPLDADDGPHFCRNYACTIAGGQAIRTRGINRPHLPTYEREASTEVRGGHFVIGNPMMIIRDGCRAVVGDVVPHTL